MIAPLWCDVPIPLPSHVPSDGIGLRRAWDWAICWRLHAASTCADKSTTQNSCARSEACSAGSALRERTLPSDRQAAESSKTLQTRACMPNASQSLSVALRTQRSHGGRLVFGIGSRHRPDSAQHRAAHGVWQLDIRQCLLHDAGMRCTDIPPRRSSRDQRQPTDPRTIGS
jgi:hypothetical protein